jgi:predicted transcriptional regulator
MKNYLTGDTSYRVYDKIDGIKSVNEIGKNLQIDQIKVYNICKNLVKMGFISFN